MRKIRGFLKKIYSPLHLKEVESNQNKINYYAKAKPLSKVFMLEKVCMFKC